VGGSWRQMVCFYTTPPLHNFPSKLAFSASIFSRCVVSNPRVRRRKQTLMYAARRAHWCIFRRTNHHSRQLGDVRSLHAADESSWTCVVGHTCVFPNLCYHCCKPAKMVSYNATLRLCCPSHIQPEARRPPSLFLRQSHHRHSRQRPSACGL
jgi:hypothetical protein